MIWDSPKKDDRRGAQVLERLGAGRDAQLHATRHRDGETRARLCVFRPRERVVETRTSLVTAAHGMVKALGYRADRRLGPA